MGPASRRAREMMLGGLLGGHIAGLAVFGAALIFGGPGAAMTVALGFAAVVIFYAVGQAIEVVAAELPDLQGLSLVMVSYAVRVVGIAGGLWFILDLPAVRSSLREGWLLLSVVATVLSWVSGVVLVAARQRIPVFDSEYHPPSVD